MRIRPSFEQSSRLKYVVLAFAVLYMALYPIYTNYHKGLGLEQYARHLGFFTGDILFPNPWQYRVLSHWIVEGIYQTYTHTIGRIIDIESLVTVNLPGASQDKFDQTRKLLEQIKTPGYITYNLVFVFFRLVTHLLIFWVAFLYYKKFVKSDWLMYFGIILISLSFGNSVNDSDLAFNTYLDVLFYLLVGYIIVSEKYDWYLLPVTILAALNRETSVLIPFVYFIARIDWKKVNFADLKLNKLLPSKKTILITGVSYLFFWTIFVGLRIYYGLEAYQGVRGAPSGFSTLIINLFSLVSIKTYFEMYGTFMVLPIIVLYKFKRIDPILRALFIALVPVWFFVHLWAAVAYQSRLFLVPTLLVFLPAALQIIEKDVLQNVRPPKREPLRG